MTSSCEAMDAAFYFWEGETLVLDILARPGARKDAIGAVQAGRLKVQIAATAESGRATRHLLIFLAETFGVPRAAVTLVFGERSARKRVRIMAPRILPANIPGRIPPSLL